MVVFSLLEKKGNLGNQLFQIASTIGIAKKNKTPFAFPNWKYADYFDPSNSYLMELGYASSVDSPNEESEKLQYDTVVKNINGFEGNKLLILVKPEKK